MKLRHLLFAALCLAASPLFTACGGSGESDTTATDSTAMVTTDTMQHEQDNGTTLNDVDRDFIAKISEANMAEVDAGKAASTKGMNAKVKDFGNQMVTDHTTANTELATVASAVGVPMTDSLNEEHKALKQKLTAAKGKAFDQAYIESQVADHQKVLDIFQNEMHNGSHQQVKDFANKFHHHIQMHYDMADSIQKNLGGMKK
jgi:putative membrane protein